MSKEIVRRAVVLRSEDSFGGEPEQFQGKKKKKKKKHAGALKPLEKTVRELAKVGKTYYDRHEESNRKKKNGWLRDLPKNVTKSTSKLMKATLFPIPMDLGKLF